ncbi:hypothetical protein FEM41_08940 [Jejubacter calystegiae]|uniref:Uncharacterized protein n=1 Tax=Jejubacter calystegiae TaxID=2579935 RepID=A0A4P8YJ56_9ENTR|nr:hypothetical protein [Jejubacter calystegiae]QCT19768.1 hypothetical protein FEM41_08940 [Jejubacter calystegiae]
MPLTVKRLNRVCWGGGGPTARPPGQVLEHPEPDLPPVAHHPTVEAMCRDRFDLLYEAQAMLRA